MVRRKKWVVLLGRKFWILAQILIISKSKPEPGFCQTNTTIGWLRQKKIATKGWQTPIHVTTSISAPQLITGQSTDDKLVEKIKPFSSSYFHTLKLLCLTQYVGGGGGGVKWAQYF